eukprot:scaffold902_cov242-Pinguiococcus_pyrenoidosus.AAC.12
MTHRRRVTPNASAGFASAASAMRWSHSGTSFETASAYERWDRRQRGKALVCAVNAARRRRASDLRGKHDPHHLSDQKIVASPELHRNLSLARVLLSCVAAHAA